MAEEIKKVYTKLLKSKYNPPNNCFVPEDEILTIKSKKTFPIKDTEYHFIGTINSDKKSKYGWVVETDAFSFNEFIDKYVSINKSEMDEFFIKKMLDVISKQKVGSPLAVNFTVRGVLEKKTILTIHKVIFYDK